MSDLSPPLPRWDLTPAFPSLDSPKFQTEFADVSPSIEAMASRFDRLGVRRRAESTVNAAFAASVNEVLGAWNALSARLDVLFSYLHCLVSTDAKDEAAQARLSQLELQTVALDALETRLVAWIGTSDIDSLLEQSSVAREHEFWIRRVHVLATHQMSESEEHLAAALRPMGYAAWSKLHGQMTALLTAPIELDGELRTLPMSAVRALASHPDRNVRGRAFEAEMEAWPKVALPLAASLNSIKGFARELRIRRGWSDDVAPTLLGNSIDPATLAAMQGACAEAFPDFRRYLQAKARVLGVEKLAWFDLIAPVGGADERWEWDRCEEFIERNFGRYSDKMAAYARRTFNERWIDAGPRVGKEGGAYCTEMGAGQSRISMNFDGSFTQVSTLAHELGHGYHNDCLQSRAPLQKQIPMTLAETSSIFCETLVFEAAVERAEKAEKLFLLDNALSRNLQVVVDIHSRFLFEQSVFQNRADGELGETQLCDLMTQAQHQTYGEDVSPLHPYIWAVKGHYYGPTFYNYPYTFGLLFALGLYARFKENPEEFRAKYDDFLSRCGLEDAATLAREFGFDITQPEFWRASLEVIRAQINEFVELVG